MSLPDSLKKSKLDIQFGDGRATNSVSLLTFAIAFLSPLATSTWPSRFKYAPKMHFFSVNHLYEEYTYLLHILKVLIGCDGVNSIVAKWLTFNPPSFTKRSSIRGYVDLKEGHGLNPEFLQFTGHGFRYGIVPCDDTSIYWFFMLSPFYNKGIILY